MFDHDAFDCVLRERFADDFEVAYAYDRFGRLAETVAGFGAKVTYAYDSKGRLSRQVVDGSPIEYEYTKYGQLAAKHLGGKLNPDAAVEYEYAKNGQIVARTANGVRQTFEYDKKGQLLGVKEGEEYVERYAYDKAGNMVKKVVRGSRFVVRDGVETLVRDGEYKTTTFTFDDANQLVSSTTDGETTRYEYDAAGRMIKEGDKTYTYGYLDKVMSVRFDRSSANSSTSQPLNSSTVYTYTYHPDGQLASANYGDSSEDFAWDGLALIQRGNEQFVNEPHVGGGNPVASSNGTSYFNDMLGTTVGAKRDGKQYSAAALTAFGEDLNHHSSTSTSHFNSFFTGKPEVAGLGHAFLMRNYRASLSKWQTADPLGYPDGWNALAYCNNGVTSAVDLWGCFWGFGDDDPTVGDPKYIGSCYGDFVAIPGIAGTDVWCDGTKPDHIDVVIGRSFSVNIKAAPDTKNLIAGLTTSIISSVTSFLSGITISVDVKEQKTVIQLDKWICDADHHTHVTSRRGMANVRIMLRPYVDIYMQEHESGKCTFFVTKATYSITYVVDKIKDCVE